MTTMNTSMEYYEVEQSSRTDVIDHSHCNTCIKVTRCIAQSTHNQSCEIVTCELNCGFLFHACKLSEHKLLCANEKVACINADNGCPVILIRHQRAMHLETCPASVVMCTMEWNRWPVCSQKHQMHFSFHVQNLQAKEDQLDIALALRDQRMLDKWMKVPYRIQRVLQNNLTKCHPAVPLESWPSYEEENFVVSPSVILKECKKSQPGVQSSVSEELHKVARGHFDNAVTNSLIHFPNNQPATPQAIYGILPTVLNASNAQQTDHNVFKTCLPQSVEHNEALLNGVDMKSGCQHFNVSGDARNIERDSLNEAESMYEEDRKQFNMDLLNNAEVSEIFSAPVMDHCSSITPPITTRLSVDVNLGLDLTLESITRYQTKPKNMYTFLCAQEFRRDEYAWHYKNVHNDIHGGLNGWLEHRCPLAHYGCTYSSRRFYPAMKGSTVIHNDILESFGVKPYVPYDSPVVNQCSKSVKRNLKSQFCNKSYSVSKFHMQNSEDTQDWSVTSSQCVVLCQLPFEVLRHVCRFLDSFSLCNLSLTCRRLREVCCSLLEERGIVVQKWKKRLSGSKVSWRVAYKRWFFSTAFTPVQEWGFEADNMSNHLRSCACFERNMETKPYFHLFGCIPDPLLHAKLIANGKEAA